MVCEGECFDDSRSDTPGTGAVSARYPVNVIRSANRRRTANATMLKGEIVVRIPDNCSAADERRIVGKLARGLEAKLLSASADLPSRVEHLAGSYDLPRPESIRWSSRQNQRWGSCTPSTRAIIISDRLREMPQWVIDYVIVHEMAHLVEGKHSPAFYAITDRYPLTERARGYLEGVAHAVGRAWPWDIATAPKPTPKPPAGDTLGF